MSEYILLHPSSELHICVYPQVVCLESIFHFECWCLADCANLSKMAPAVRFPGKNSKRMECAANKVGWAPLCLNYSVLVNHSFPVYAALNRRDWVLHTRAHPCLESRTRLWKLSAIDCQFSLSPDGKMCVHFFFTGLQLNSFLRIAPQHKWQLMVLVGLCTPSVVLLEWRVAQLWMQDVLMFTLNWLSCWKAPLE